MEIKRFFLLNQGDLTPVKKKTIMTGKFFLRNQGDLTPVKNKKKMMTGKNVYLSNQCIPVFLCLSQTAIYP